jgi:3-hydroxybutyryl-CoA dehydratase
VTIDRHFDDLREGERFATRGRTITEADVGTFAGLTGDWHPQHADAEWARASGFGERIAHGLLVLSCAAGLVPFDPDRVIALRAVRDATFKRPVPLGTTIHVEGRIADVQPTGDESGIVGCEIKVVDQRGRTVIRGRIDVIWRRGAAPAAAREPSDDGTVVPL